MRSLASVFVLLGMVGVALGQEALPIASDYVPRPSIASAGSIAASQQPPTPVLPVTVSPTAASPAELRGEKIEHLLKAAEHLQLAGLHEEARKICGRAAQEKAAVAADITALQAEIERLRSITQHTPQVLLKLRILELPLTKIQKLGFDFSRVLSGHVQVGLNNLCVLASNDPFFGVLEALRADGLAKVLAEPTLVTVSNRPASYQSGGEFPIPMPQGNGPASLEFKQYGTSIDFVPIVMADQTIRLEFRARISELVPGKTVTIAGAEVPAIRAFQVDTGAELRSGQTLVLVGPVRRRTTDDRANSPATAESVKKPEQNREASEAQVETATLFLVTPEIVELTPSSKPTSPPPAAN